MNFFMCIKAELEKLILELSTESIHRNSLVPDKFESVQ